MTNQEMTPEEWNGLVNEAKEVLRKREADKAMEPEVKCTGVFKRYQEEIIDKGLVDEDYSFSPFESDPD